MAVLWRDGLCRQRNQRGRQPIVERLVVGTLTIDHHHEAPLFARHAFIVKAEPQKGIVGSEFDGSILLASEDGTGDGVITDVVGIDALGGVARGDIQTLGEKGFYI